MKRRLRFSTLLLLIWMGAAASLVRAQPAEEFPLTVKALQRACLEESEEVQTYGAFSRRAREEGYEGIGRLFAALQASETIHRRNFRRLLLQLGVEPRVHGERDMPLVGTRKNLRAAAERELEDIDQDYLEMLELAAPEEHGEALRYLTHAWTSEKRHRDLIEEVLRGSSFLFFGLVVSKTEEVPAYFVCDICGFILLEPPSEECPVCHSPPSVFSRVE